MSQHSVHPQQEHPSIRMGRDTWGCLGHVLIGRL
jgi:hypothetical protein